MTVVVGTLALVIMIVTATIDIYNVDITLTIMQITIIENTHDVGATGILEVMVMMQMGSA